MSQINLQISRFGPAKIEPVIHEADLTVLEPATLKQYCICFHFHSAQEAETELRMVVLIIVGVPRHQRLTADAEDSRWQEQEQRGFGSDHREREAGK